MCLLLFGFDFKSFDLAGIKAVHHSHASRKLKISKKNQGFSPPPKGSEPQA